jgi:hypothetical protein
MSSKHSTVDATTAKDGGRKRAHGLVVETIRTLRSHLKPLLMIICLVALPSTFISTYLANDPSGSTPAASGISVYLSMATLLLNLALIWAAGRMERGESIGLGSAYYQGTASLVRFLLVALAITAACLPAAFGVLLYQYGSVSATAAVSGGELVLLGVLAALFILPAVILLSRFIFALDIVVDSDARPVAALRASWKLTRGKTRRVLGALVKLMLVFLVVVVPIATGLAFTQSVTLIAILDFFVLLLLLPFMNVYMYKLYRSLSA